MMTAFAATSETAVTFRRNTLPMAISLMSGLVVAAVLTLLFVPALHAAFVGVQRESGAVNSPPIAVAAHTAA